jgi:hypothetical protein
MKDKHISNLSLANPAHPLLAEPGKKDRTIA